MSFSLKYSGEIIKTYSLSHGNVLILDSVDLTKAPWSSMKELEPEYRVYIRDYSTDNLNNPLDYGVFTTGSLVEALMKFIKRKEEETI